MDTRTVKNLVEDLVDTYNDDQMMALDDVRYLKRELSRVQAMLIVATNYDLRIVPGN